MTNKLLVVVGFGPILLRCNLDGTGCTETMLQPAGGSSVEYTPSAVLDTVNSKLMVVSVHSAGSDFVGPNFFRCNSDGSDCTHHAIAMGGEGTTPSVVIDSVNNRLLIASDDGFSPSLTRCNIDGTGCTLLDIVVGGHLGQSTRAVLDTTNGRLVIACDAPGVFTLGVW